MEIKQFVESCERVSEIACVSNRGKHWEALKFINVLGNGLPLILSTRKLDCQGDRGVTIASVSS